MAHWNYRVMRDPDNADFPYSIREVHYDDDNRPVGYTEEPTTFLSETVDGLRQDLEWASRSIMEPVLEPKDFVGKVTS